MESQLSDSRLPGSRTCLSGPPSLCDRAASLWLLSSSMLLLLTVGLRSFSMVRGDDHCHVGDTSDRQNATTSLDSEASENKL